MDYVYAVAGGTFIFVGVVILILLAVVYTFYTRSGSAIENHPNDGLDGSPGSEEPGSASGAGRVSEVNPEEFTAGGGFSTHGTK